jgi:hypothetical protein
MYNIFFTLVMMLRLDPMLLSHQLCHALERFAGLDKHHTAAMAAQIEQDLLKGKGRREKIHMTV